MSLHAGDRSWGSNHMLFKVREGIARALGIEDRGEYYSPFFTNDTLMGYWHNPEDSVFSGVHEPADDIDYLMLHQDCMGVLPPFAVRRVAKRLRDILVHIPDDSVWPTFNTRQNAVELLDFLEYADEEGEWVVFSG